VTFGDPAFSTKDGGSVKVDGAEKVRNMLVTGAGDFVFYGNEQGVGVTADDTGAGNGTLTIYQFVSATDSSRLAKTVADVDMTFHGAFGTGSRANGASVYVQSGALQIGDGTSDMVGNIIADHGIYLAGTQQTGSFSPAGGMLIFNRQGNTDFDGETTDCGDACDKFVFEQSVLGSGTVEVAGGKLLWLQGSRGANTFQGDVQVNGGTLVVTGDVAANTLAATASRTLNGGTLELARGNGAFDFNWTLAKNSGNAINVNSVDEAGSSNKETLAGKLSGEGGFSKNGDGELVLAAANDYQGDTYANQGRLTGNIAPKTNLTVASGATYDGADVDGDGGETSARVVSALNGGGVIQNTNGFTVSSGNFSGSIDGSNHGGLTKVSDDTDTHGYLILSGSNDYSGLTDIQGGTLEITSTGSINHSDVNVASGAELELVGKIGQNVNAASGSSVNLEDGSSIAGSLNAAANSTVGVYGHSSVGGDLNASGSTMNFRLPDGVKNQETLLTVAGNANVEGTTVNLIAPLRQDLSYLTQGNRVNLIAAKNVSGATVSGQSQLTVKAVIGSALVYNFSIEESYSNDDGAADTIVARLLNAPSGSMGNISGGGTQPQPDTSYYKAWSEGFISSLALANQGGDVVANQAMRLAEAATNGKVGIGAFGTVVGGNSRYETGSHAKVKSVNGIAGISFTPKTSSGALAIGAFFEYGHGDYDTYNSFTGSKSDSHNGGNAHYVGGGFLAHYGFDGNAARADDLMPARGGYVEGSLRGGQMRNSFTARDLSGNDEIPMEAGKKGNYDTNSSYFSAHVGGGYVFGLGAKTDLDVYAKGFYTRQGGDKVTAKNDAKLDFDSANSTRLRVGARATRLFGTKVSGYAGLAYEREFSGKVNAKVEGYRIDAPQLKGNTGVGELGITVKPSAKVPLSVDFGVQGYVGEQRGVSGSLSLKYSF
jgi:outer membrane autotransporter protein